MRYEPRNPHHLRYVVGGPAPEQRILDVVEEYTLNFAMLWVMTSIRLSLPFVMVCPMP